MLFHDVCAVVSVLCHGGLGVIVQTLLCLTHLSPCIRPSRGPHRLGQRLPPHEQIRKYKKQCAVFKSTNVLTNKRFHRLRDREGFRLSERFSSSGSGSVYLCLCSLSEKIVFVFDPQRDSQCIQHSTERKNIPIR